MNAKDAYYVRCIGIQNNYDACNRVCTQMHNAIRCSRARVASRCNNAMNAQPKKCIPKNFNLCLHCV